MSGRINQWILGVGVVVACLFTRWVVLGFVVGNLVIWASDMFFTEADTAYYFARAGYALSLVGGVVVSIWRTDLSGFWR